MSKYLCASCGEQLSLKQTVSDKEIDRFCPKCQDIMLEQLLGFKISKYLRDHLKDTLVEEYCLTEYDNVVYSDDEICECSGCGEYRPDCEYQESEDGRSSSLCKECRRIY